MKTNKEIIDECLEQITHILEKKNITITVEALKSLGFDNNKMLLSLVIQQSYHEATQPFINRGVWLCEDCKKPQVLDVSKLCECDGK